ncbi:MAG TPA: LPS export ABC transporter periplasmic protein LptC [Casimicrobiaceae bacterium]|nr:LPS export ABC transporter periplasmic protein LptC [Casimicrobiaceae bacterium]
MNIRQWLTDRIIGWSPALLLGALAAMTYWLNTQVQPPPPKFDGSGRHDPDVYLENFKAENLDDQGRVHQALMAHAARHFPDDDSTELDAPQITFNDPGKPRLTVTADHATISGDREHVDFIGHVKGVRDASSDTAHDGPTTISSEYLRVLPKDDRIVTDKPVTITDPRGIINATGMEYDNKTKTVKLRSRVSGRFEPEAK